MLVNEFPDAHSGWEGKVTDEADRPAGMATSIY